MFADERIDFANQILKSVRFICFTQVARLERINGAVLLRSRCWPHHARGVEVGPVALSLYLTGAADHGIKQATSPGAKQAGKREAAAPWREAGNRYGAEFRLRSVQRHD
jgi:hypothetical protein